MNLKTFTAKSMAEALAQVRKDIGADAVVLHTRTFQRGGILGLGARQYVEVTAASGKEYGRKQRSNPQRPRTASRSNGPTPSRRQPSAQDTSGENDAQNGPAGDLIRRTYAAARAEMQRTQDAAQNTPQDTAQTSAPPQTPQTPQAPAAPAPQAESTNPNANTSNTDPDQIADEMRSVKRMVARMMSQQQQRDTARPDVPDKLFDQYLALLEQEVAEELAGEVVQQVRGSLSHEQLQDEQACREAVMHAVAELLPGYEEAQKDAQKNAASDGTAQTSVGAVSEDAGASSNTNDNRPRTIALVGPTGVGKTTTIAKLAATLKLKQEKNVGLITMDTYRIAAVDQLQTYAKIVGVPLHVVSGPEQMRQAIKKCAGCDVVLIDTAGRSQRDDPRLEELRTFLEAAQPHETHLVLSSTCTQRVLEDTIERFSKINTDRIIFTKLDEAVTFGVVLNVLRKVSKQLSYVTTGQEVPHQIEPGRPDRLAALMLGEQAVAQ